MSEVVQTTLESGVRLEFRDIAWTSSGRMFCQVVAFAPDESILGNSKVEMSSSGSRYQLARELAAHNGAGPDLWNDELLAAWHGLDQDRSEAAEKFDMHSLISLAEPGPQEYVWDPLLPVGYPSNIYGDGGASKSTTMMGLAVAIAQGLPFPGLPTIRGPVFYLDWELDEESFLRRLYPICRGMGIPVPPRELYYTRLTESINHHLANIIDACQRTEPALVLIDSLGPATMADPNDAEAFIRVIQDLRKLKRASATIDHQSKGAAQSYRTKRAIGTGYKDFLVRGGVQLELSQSVPGRSSIVLRHSKHNFTYGHEPIPFHIIYGNGIISFEAGAINSPEFADSDTLTLPMRVLKTLAETAQAIDAGQLLETTGGGSRQSLKNAVSKLRNKGHAIKTIQGPKKTVSYFLEP